MSKAYDRVNWSTALSPRVCFSVPIQQVELINSLLSLAVEFFFIPLLIESQIRKFTREKSDFCLGQGKGGNSLHHEEVVASRKQGDRDYYFPISDLRELFRSGNEAARLKG